MIFYFSQENKYGTVAYFFQLPLTLRNRNWETRTVKWTKNQNAGSFCGTRVYSGQVVK